MSEDPNSGPGPDAEEQRSGVIGIVGMGATGRVLAEALRAVGKNYELWGHDREPERTREAQRAALVDKAEWNLPALAEVADLLLLTEPLDELVETIEIAAPHARTGALISDTSSVKVPVLEAARQHVPAGVSFIGGHPILRRTGKATGANRLRGVAWCLVPLESASDKAMRSMTRLVEAVGARPYYIDAQEHDSLVAGVRHLPFLADLAMALVLGSSPSADDLSRLAGPAVTDLMDHSEVEGREIRETLAGDTTGIVAWLDQLLEQLMAIRRELSEGDASSIDELLASADELRAAWASEAAEIESSGKAFDEIEDYSATEHLLFGGFLRRLRP